MVSRSEVSLRAGALILLEAVILLPWLGQEICIEGREARHAEIAREMLETGNFVLPQVCGEPYVDKPPLFNCIVALFFKIAGRVDFTIARLPSVFCGAAAAVGVYLLGRRWFDPRAGWFAASIWITSSLVIEWSRMCRMDMMMACLILYGIIVADVAAAAETSRRRRIAWYGASALIGLATLAKGPHAILFFAVAAIAIWRVRRSRWAPDWSLVVVGGFITLAIALLWAVAAELTHPGQLKALLGYEFGEALIEHDKRWYLYLDQLLIRTMPWSVLGIGAVWWAVSHIRRRSCDFVSAVGLVLAVCLLGMTIVKNKREHYLLPILPLWSVLIGAFLDRALAVRREQGRRETERIPPWAFEWVLTAVLAGSALAMVVAVRYWTRLAQGGIALGAAILISAGSIAAAGAVAVVLRRLELAATALFVSVLLVAATGWPMYVRYYARPDPSILAMQQIARAIPPGVPVAAYKMPNEYLYVKLNRPVLFAQTVQAVESFLAEPGPRYLIVRTKTPEELAKIASGRLQKVGEWRFSRRIVTVFVASPATGARRGLDATPEAKSGKG